MLEKETIVRFMNHSLSNQSNSQAISEKTNENDYASQSGYTKHAQLTELQVRRKKLHTALTLTILLRSAMRLHRTANSLCQSAETTCLNS